MSSFTQAAYASYLSSPHWRALRSRKLSRHPFCQICGAHAPLQVHHVNYRADWLDCRLRDLVTLCQECHKDVHQALNSGQLHYSKNTRSMDRMRATLAAFGALPTKKQRLASTRFTDKVCLEFQNHFGYDPRTR